LKKQIPASSPSDLERPSEENGIRVKIFMSEFPLNAYSKAFELYPETDFSVPIDLDGKLQL
jgi:hypothetical protein